MLSVYKDSNFRHHLQYIYSSIPSLDNLGDKISSLEVVPRFSKIDQSLIEVDDITGEPFEAFFAFQHADYKGDIYGPFMLCFGYNYAGDFGFQDNEISSVECISSMAELKKKIITYGHRLKSETQIYSKSTQTQYKGVGSFFTNLSEGNLDGMLKSIGHRTGVTLRIPVDRLYKFGEGVDKNAYDLLTDLGEAGENLADTLGDIATEGTEWIDDRIKSIFDWLEWWDKWKWWVIGFIVAIIILIIASILYFLFIREPKDTIGDRIIIQSIPEQPTPLTIDEKATIIKAISPVPSITTAGGA